MKKIIVINFSINSSKVYCKCIYSANSLLFLEVLIVAKCIVNKKENILRVLSLIVLIVAKCIVN